MRFQIIWISFSYIDSAMPIFSIDLMQKRKFFIFNLILGICLILLVSCWQKVASPLRIGTNLWPGYETLYLARHLGYYQQQPIQLVDYPSGTEEVRAYRNGEIEGAGLSIDQALTLAATQEDVKIIAVMDFSQGADVILAKPEIANMQALKGKKIGVESTALGAFFLARALEKNQLSPEDIQIVSLELAEHERAFKENRVDAVVTFGPAKAKLEEIGAKIIFDSSQIPGEIVDVLVVKQQEISKRPRVIQALIDGRFRALKYLQTNPQEAASLIAPRTKVREEQILAAFRGMHQPDLAENQRLLSKTDSRLQSGMERLVRVMVEKKLLSKSIDTSNLLEDRFLQNAR